jgi:peptidoglycan/LPS O-acetylase OafA/YrhL
MDHRLSHLDLMRGAAAIAVCIGHVRGFFFVDWRKVTDVTFVDYLFYFCTGFGHQAVIIFFVLSGYFVGGSVASTWANGTWSWRRYLARRIVRLEIVLIPALLLTCLLDGAGIVLTNGIGYDGSYAKLVNSGPAIDQPLDNGFLTFFGNVSFLMTISVPVFGSNGPLWSLANEFWYYIMFPLIWLTILGKGIHRYANALLGAGIFVWLPQDLVISGVMWLLGYVAWEVCHKPSWKEIGRHPLWLATTSCLLFATLWGSKWGYWYGSDLSLSAASALLVTALAVQNKPSNQEIHSAYRTVVARLADMSYSLYLCHFSFLSFVWFSFRAPTQFQPDAIGYSAFGLMLAVTLAYVYGVWWLTERHTNTLKKYIERRL